jgi:hypothetical protein
MKLNIPPERIWQSEFPQDIEYVRIDIVEQMVKAAREKCAEICKGIKDTHWDSERGYGAELCKEEIRETMK